MRDGKSESVQAHSQHHVVWSVVAVALAAAVKKSGHGLPAEHHSAARHTAQSIQQECLFKAKAGYDGKIMRLSLQ